MGPWLAVVAWTAYSTPMYRVPRSPLQPLAGSTRPGWLWDRDLSVDEVRGILGDRQEPRRLELLAALLREARPDEVWRWVTPHEVAADLDSLAPRLGRQRDFWVWLFDGWRARGYLSPDRST